MKITLKIIILSIFLITSLSYAADSSTISVTATVISRGNCRFNTTTASLNFGNLNPANPVDVTANTAVSFRCTGGGQNREVTFFIGDNDGLYETGPNANRMRHTTISTEYLPYNFNLNPTSGTVPRNTNQILSISGTVRGVDYQNAATGNYSDTVVITIEP